MVCHTDVSGLSLMTVKGLSSSYLFCQIFPNAGRLWF